VEYLIFNLCGGEAGRREALAQMTIVEAIKWSQLQKYDAFMQKKAIDEARKK
jgi:hypothetical protein